MGNVIEGNFGKAIEAEGLATIRALLIDALAERSRLDQTGPKTARMRIAAANALIDRVIAPDFKSMVTMELPMAVTDEQLTQIKDQLRKVVNVREVEMITWYTMCLADALPGLLAIDAK